MKRCPACQNTYHDDAQTFCTNEGARLVAVEPAELEPQPTMFAPTDTMVSNPSLSKELRPNIDSGSWSGQASWPPQPAPLFSTSSETAPRPRSPLLMIGGGLLLLLLGLGIGFAVVTFNGKTPAEAQGGSPAATTTSAKTHADAAVLAELKELESQMTNASIKGDKDIITRILADDYTGTGADGKFYNKTQTLYSTEAMPSVTSWSIDNPRLLSRGETSATLSAVITFRSGAGLERQQITDTFVRRDGRWQLLASQSTLLK